jgi:hypothetical protein
MTKVVEITITETSGRYIFPESGEMIMEDNPNAGAPDIKKEAIIEEDKIQEYHKMLSEMFPTCHVNFVWEWKPGKPKNFIAGVSGWAMETEY